MTTAQIIILSVSGIIYLISWFIMSIKLKENDLIKNESVIFFNLISVLIIFCSALAFILSFNNLEKRNGKCPEYEKVENVYKLKQ